MRIIYLCLKNFANIYTGMKKRKLEIDFSKCKNRTVLLIGENGSGKTSILRELHPFSYSDDLILTDKDGYKEIHIQDNDTVYIIKHHSIFNKSGRTTKSFISKDGVELNVNGNVRSFNEIVSFELGIEIDYLKLMRLGPNVVNFIDMKASERKNFTSNLLSDIDIYSQFYKKINEDSRFLKTLLKSITDKIDKLKILDETDIENNILMLDQVLSNLKSEKDSINSSIWTAQGNINSLIPDGVEEFLIKLKDETVLVEELKQDVYHNTNRIKKLDVVLVGSVENTISNINLKITNNENTIMTNTNMIDFYFKQLEIYYTQKEDKENSLKYVSSDLEYSKLSEMYLQFTTTKEKYDKLYKNYTPKCTKNDMLTALRLMQELDLFISNIHTFDHDAVVKVIKHIINKDNIEYVVKENVSRIDTKIANLNMKAIGVTNTNNNIYVLLQPPECKVNKCSYINFYRETNGISNETTIGKIKKEIKELEGSREFFLSLLDISKNIDYILLLIKSNSALIERMPEKFFDISKILLSIKDCTPFYNEATVTSYITALEELEEYIQLKDKIKDIRKELSFIDKNSVSLKSMRKELGVLDASIVKIQEDISKLKDDNTRFDRHNRKFKDILESLGTYKEMSSNIALKTKALEHLLTSIYNKTDIKKRIEEFVGFKRSGEKEISIIESKIQKIEDEINDNKFKLKEFSILTNERLILEDKFDEINILKEALSSNKGMPLLFIQLYLKNTKMIVNNLLDFIFKGELEIDDFDINDKEFKIPYIKNGIRVDDIIHTSQGEKSFMSLAMSFALMSQSIDKYNILLLDEIDSTLSQKNRYLFLDILEKQLDSINAEQAFLITHNNTFDAYPVDLIITSDVNIDSYRNMNIIYNNAA